VENKKWPVLASIIIALGVVGSLGGILGGFLNKDILNIIFGVAGLVIFWNVYKFKSWALTALTILMSLRILLTIFAIIGGIPLGVGLFPIVIAALIIVYFNSSKIKALFA